MVVLRDGSEVQDRRLDRIPEQDWRSLNFLIRSVVAAETRAPTSKFWELNHYLDQGQEGACVGFGCAHELAATPVAVSGVTNQYAREVIYWGAQRDDPWPGGSYPGADPVYEGTSVLSGVKVLTGLGYYTAYNHALNARDVAYGIGYDGPCILGLNWYEGMWDPDAYGFLRPTGARVGGHCILAIGVEIVFKPDGTDDPWSRVNTDQSYVLLHNSWGLGWGVNGRAKLSLTDLDRLLAEQGDAVFPVRNPLLISTDGDMMAFSDIQNNTHRAAIEWAAGEGLVTGYPDGTFKPNEPVTRGQLCSILERFYNRYH